YRFDLLAFQQSLSMLQEKQLVTKTDVNTVTVDFVTYKESSLLLTLPYYKGWNANIECKHIKIQKAHDGFMKVDVSP
ncbi:YfhO family protein, partial [Streptococcus suis]